MATTVRIGVAVAMTAGMLAIQPLPAMAQRSETNLGSEAQAYRKQDPSSVLAAFRTAAVRQTLMAPGATCQPLPPPNPVNDHHYYLSEVGGCAQLACFLQQVPNTVHANATLVVDQECTGPNAITEPLVLPDRFTLAGVGIDGAGVLAFDLPDNATAIRFADSADVANRMTTIRDLNLAGGCCGQTGIDVSNSQFVYLSRVRLQNFAFGLSGRNAFSIFVDQSSLHNNAFNIVMGENTTSWRVRDSVASQGLIGIDMHPTARGHVVTGGRIEGNWGPGIHIAGSMNVIEDTWFEGNGTWFNTLHAVAIAGTGQKNRILSNLFSSQLIGDGGMETRACFNMSFANDSADVNQC